MTTITFNAGTLPPNFCPVTWQQTFNGFVNALTGTVNGLNYSQIIVSTTAPTTDLTNLWLQVTNTGIPVQLYAYSSNTGSWEPIQQNWFFPGLTDSGAANSYIVTLSYLPISQTTGGVPTSGLTTGMTFLFKAAHANTGNSTFQIKVGASVTYAAAPILIVAAQLGSGFMVANGWYMVQYDGTNFQLLNPDITAIASLLIPPPQPVAFAVLESSPPISINVTAVTGMLLQTYNHGFSGIPAFVRPVLVCLSDDASFLAGQEVAITEFMTRGAVSIVGHAFSGSFPAFSVRTSATQITTWIIVGPSTNNQIMVLGDGAFAPEIYFVDPTKWNYKVYVSK